MVAVEKSNQMNKEVTYQTGIAKKNGKNSSISYQITFKVPTRPTGFLLFWFLYNVLKGILRKKIGFQHFNPLRSSSKVPASATPSEGDPDLKQV